MVAVSGVGFTGVAVAFDEASPAPSELNARHARATHSLLRRVTS